MPAPPAGSARARPASSTATAPRPRPSSRTARWRGSVSLDSGLAWRAAHSGRTVYRSAEMADMLACGAARRVRRPARRLRLALAAQPAPDARAARGHPPPRGRPRVLLRRGDPLVVRAPLGPARRRGQGRRALQPPAVAADPGGLRLQAGEGARPGRPPAVRLPAQRRRSSSSPTRSACAIVARVFELAAAGLPDRAVAAERGAAAVHRPGHPHLAPLRWAAA